MADFRKKNRNEHRNGAKKDRNFYAVFALICSMIAMITLCCFSFTNSIIFGVGAISFAIISKNNTQKLSRPARIAIVFGVSAILCGVAEYFYALKVMEHLKDPAMIPEINQLYGEIEKFILEQSGIGGALTSH